MPWFVFALLFLPMYLRMVRVRLLETFDRAVDHDRSAKGRRSSRPRGTCAANAMGPRPADARGRRGHGDHGGDLHRDGLRAAGIGSLAVRAFSGEQGGFDLPLTAGIVIVVGTFVVLLNVAADVAGAWLDPRIRTTTRAGWSRCRERLRRVRACGSA